jgi:hypothetical protein
MSEVFLGLITIGTLIAFVAYVYMTNKEKSKLVNALMSKTSQEFINAELTDKVKIEQPKNVPQDTAIEDIPDDEYLKIITGREATGGEDGQE